MNINSIIYIFKKTASKISRALHPIRGKNNVFKNKATYRGISLNISGNSNEIIFSEKSILDTITVYIRGNGNRILIENNCLIKNSVLWVENDNSLLQIGAKTTIEGAHFGMAENNQKIILGKDCMLSDGIYITTTDSHSIIKKDTGERCNYSKDVIIGDHVWIGKNATILKGTTIMKNAIIGTSSVVNSTVESFSIFAGIPAKKIKGNTNWLREKI